MTFYNYKNNNLIRNYNINDDYSDIIKEKKYKKRRIGYSIERKNMKNYIKKKILEKNKLNFEIKEKVNYCKIPESTKNYYKKKFNKVRTNNKIVKPKKIINYYYKNIIYNESNKSNNDSINKSNKNGDKKSIISTNLTSHINSQGIINPLYRKKN